jgi:hypothetical protein
VCQELRDCISVHVGIWAAAVKMDDRCLHKVERAMLDSPGWPLVILGHSLGAGTATLLGLRWRSRGLFPGFKVSRSLSLPPPPLSLSRARALSLSPTMMMMSFILFFQKQKQIASRWTSLCLLPLPSPAMLDGSAVCFSGSFLRLCSASAASSSFPTGHPRCPPGLLS